MTPIIRERGAGRQFVYRCFDADGRLMFVGNEDLFVVPSTRRLRYAPA